MLALEQHIRVPFEAQLADSDIAEYPSAQLFLRRLSDVSNAHIDSLRAVLDEFGGHEAQPVKSAITGVAGVFASAIDRVRKTKVAKGLRDDYAALSLCTISYGMLLTTANAYGMPTVADLAQKHLREYAQLVMEIGLAMPEIVVYDLQQTGMPAETSVISPSRSAIEDAWQTGAAAQRSQTTTGSITRESPSPRRV
jgi:hypothetical protein